MDSVTGAADRREALRAKLDEARGAIHRAASAAAIKNDPLAEQMDALAETLTALGALYDASADTQLEIADKLRTQADAMANEAIERVHASGVGIIDQLAPRLAVMVDKTTRAQMRISRLRVLLGGAAGLVISLGFAAGVAYAAGFASGRAQGEIAAQTIAAAMAAGPSAATTWSSLMADNDPVQALAACKKSVSSNTQGRHYCAMPVWLDPPTAETPGQ